MFYVILGEGGIEQSRPKNPSQGEKNRLRLIFLAVDDKGSRTSHSLWSGLGLDLVEPETGKDQDLQNTWQDEDFEGTGD